MEYTKEHRPMLLEQGDMVTFAVDGIDYPYQFCSNYLDFQSHSYHGPSLRERGEEWGGNDTIFGVLGLSKREFCNRFYSVECEDHIDGYWPEPEGDHEDGDYDDRPGSSRVRQAMTQLVNALLDLCMGEALEVDFEARLDNPEKYIRVIVRMNQVLGSIRESIKRYKYRHCFDERDRDFAEYCLRPYIASGLIEKVKETGPDGKERNIYYNREPRALNEMLQRFSRMNIRQTLVS